MKKIFLIILFSIFLYSCNQKSNSIMDLQYSFATNFSDIRFWEFDDNEYPFPVSEIEEQIRIINSHDPVKDSKNAHLRFNNRFIGFLGISLITPGVDVERLDYKDRMKTLALWGLTDVNPNDQLQIASFRYCYLYNTNILKLTKREHLKIELNEWEISLIKRYYPDFKP